MAGGIRYVSAGPLSVLAILLLIALVILLIPLLILGIIGAAFTRLGLSWVVALALVLLMLAGSFVNIPLYRIQREMIRAVPFAPEGTGRGDLFAAPPVWDTVIALNVGGGVLPTVIAAYLMIRSFTIAGQAVVIHATACAAVVLVVAFLSTRDIPGLGIQVPSLVPALTALLAGLLLSGGPGLSAAVTALAGGVIGTLAGGNLAHLLRVRELEVPQVSIGGFGTFGAVFLCCILPALAA